LIATNQGTEVPNAETLFKEADLNKDKMVSVEELIHVMKKYPDLLSNYALYSYAVEQYNHQERRAGMQGGYLTRDHAAAGWAFQASEWMNFKDYDTGLNIGKDAAYILVYDREHGQMIKEKLSSAINLSMRSMYQTTAGRLSLMLPTTTKLMKEASELAGRMEDAKASKAKIPKFIKEMAINTQDMLIPEEDYENFNAFFMRKLKPDARPLAEGFNSHRAVQPADARLMTFDTIELCSQFWVKGKKFSIENLLESKQLALDFLGGSLVISRLAPQDYHRFHSPVDGVVSYLAPERIGTKLWTVNPVAVNSPVDVFTQNIRRFCIINSPEFGKVAFICVGATLVGSIVFNDSFQQGATLKRGEDLGSYKFGGSTCITVFQKDAIKFDSDLVDRSKTSTETLVKMGQSLGVSTK